MPTLDWIGKEAVINHHNEVPFRLLEHDPKLSHGEANTGNMLIEGDNLEALKALLPYYKGKVKCIYIDPPYNTGKEDWIYNDNVNSPQMKEWLGKVVGRDDLSRHDKWLCMMHPRLLLAKEFLHEDGVIFISIDDNEIEKLKIVMDEHFGKDNLLSNFIWKTEGNFDNQAKVKINHEYILAYTVNYTNFPMPAIIDPNIPKTSKLYKTEIRNTIVKNGPKNPISGILLPSGFPADFEEGIIKARNDAYPNYIEDIIVENFEVQNEVVASTGWSSKTIFGNFINNGFNTVLDTKGQKTKFVLTKTGAIEAVKERTEKQSHVVSILTNLGSTQSTSADLEKMEINFDYPKPVDLIEYIISLIDDKEIIVLDFFAGSGTTAISTMKLNKKDNGLRQFILVELDKKIAEEVIEKRMRKTINGFTPIGAEKNIKGLGGGFDYYRLGETVFGADGRIRESIKFKDLARHVFYSALNVPLDDDKKLGKSPLLGEHNGTAVYLLYNGILKDKSANGGNALTRKVLAELPKHEGPKIIYGTSCRLSYETLNQHNVTFRQIPYEIKVN